MAVKKLSMFGVSVKDKHTGESWEVDVVSNTVREARKIGVNAVEADGLVKRQNIKHTLVWEKVAEVWQ